MSLIQACISINCGVEEVRKLIEKGKDVNSTDSNGIPCLAYAITDLGIFKILIENGAKDNNRGDTIKELMWKLHDIFVLDSKIWICAKEPNGIKELKGIQLIIFDRFIEYYKMIKYLLNTHFYPDDIWKKHIENFGEEFVQEITNLMLMQ